MISISLLKHHAGYVRTLIRSRLTEEELKTVLLKVGMSQMDFYTGNLDPDSIFSETVAYLEKHRATDFVQYKAFIGAAGYRTFVLSDGSEWVLRLSYDDPVNFVHLHPGRYAEHTVRVKAGALKTAMAVCWQMEMERTVEIPETAEVNRLRAVMAGLSPVADQAEMNHARDIIDLLRK